MNYKVYPIGWFIFCSKTIRNRAKDESLFSNWEQQLRQCRERYC
ncbi:hypothetical protein [Clostridium beijerinckii]|nr:hypothetical protein [Clostridium beijerinckii]NRT77830.1 hypothetical protein [Clostridium beijerinckii]